jgi:hypothetical protein
MERQASYTILNTPPKRYEAYIFSKWLRSLRYGNEYFKLVDQDVYFGVYHFYIKKILEKPETETRFAVLSDDHDVVLGFSVTRKNILDYIYVHKDHRKMKVATHLLPENIDTITHVTKIGLSIWGSKYTHWKFNPFI